jgi:two-component sensor histidine kinase
LAQGADIPPGSDDPAALKQELRRTRAELAEARRQVVQAEARAEATAKSAAVLTAFASAAPGALWVAEADTGRGIYISPGVAGLLGVPAAAVLPEAGRWLGLVHPDDRPAVSARFEALCRGEAAEVSYRVLPPGTAGGDAADRPAAQWVSDLGFPIADSRGQVRRLAGFARPAAESAGEEGLRRLLLAELNHRVRNTLAAVQSIAAQTARAAPDWGMFWEAFAGRLRAMARAHETLATRGWPEGADLRALLATELAPYLNAAGQVGPRAQLDGPPVRLAPSAAVVLALAIHELATNAARHGSLSVPAGSILVSWTCSDEGGSPRLRLDWKEVSGPPPAEAPPRRGFGVRLLSKALPAQLAGRVALDFARDGLHAVIEAALSPEAKPAYAPPASPQPSRLGGGGPA